MAAAGFEQFLGELECPVCLLVPREGPVGACPVGHIVCKTCKVNVEICPTCRRPIPKDGTSIIVNKMLEQIPHTCKYKDFGCEIQKHVLELVEHESQCPERTIKCPHLACYVEVQMKKYHEHAWASNCNTESIPIDKERYTLFKFFTRNGDSIQDRISRDSNWTMKGFVGSFEGLEIFYHHQHYFAAEKTFAFYITVPLASNEAEKYLVKITLKNQNDERKSLASIQNVISMDSAPRDKKEILASKNVMFVSWRQMSGYLNWTETDGKQSSAIVTKVDIIDDE